MQAKYSAPSGWGSGRPQFVSAVPQGPSCSDGVNGKECALIFILIRHLPSSSTQLNHYAVH